MSENVIGSTDSVPSLGARLDRLPSTSYHYRWIALLGCIFLIEMFDSGVFGFVAPSIRADWDLSIGSIGLLTSAGFAGQALGAAVGGRLMDKFGRRPILIWSTFGFSAMSLFSAIAPNPEVLMISRILTGFGLQAAVSAVMIYASEMFPRTTRGRYLAILTFIGYVGLPITAVAALIIAPMHVGAWRWLFAIGGLGIIIAGAAAIWLPESVRWLVMNDKKEKAEGVVATLEAAVLRRHEVLAQAMLEVPMEAQGSFKDLFEPAYLKRLVVMSTAFSLFLFALYGFFSWLPTILTDRGMPQTEALTFATGLSVSGMIASVVLYPLSDRLERKTTVLIGALLGGAALLVFAFASNVGLSMAAGVLAQLSLGVVTTVFFTYVPEVFPTHVRGVGYGAVTGVGRIVSILSAVLVAAIYTSLGFEALYVILAVLLALAGVVTFVFGPRTTKRSLEAISSD